MKKFTILCISLISLSMAALANNVQVGNISFSGRNTTTNTVKIVFDASWENSWRTSSNENNYDGLWVFAKYRKINTSSWQHCSIGATGFTQASGSTIQPSADKKGFWLYRSANGIGNVNFTGGNVEWEYGTDNVADNDSVEIRLFAMEMVYVPQGQFFLGSGGAEVNNFFTAGGSNAFQISSESPIVFGATIGNLTYTGAGAISFSVPAAYPKGFAAFWIMKYEASQEQYVDFLNTIDQARAIFNGSGSLGLTGAHPNLIATQPTRAIGVDDEAFLSISDFSAMRPMSELEYEKACRGANIIPVPNEYAWGNTSYTILGSLIDNGLETETQNSPRGNANMNTFNPIRCGLFATSLTAANRDLSGGSFYGGMEMTGNLYERVVNIQTLASRNFSKTIHGDGNIDANGNSDISTWTLSVYGVKGGAFNVAPTQGRISDRFYVFNAYPDGFNSRNGIRMVRTAE